MIRGYLLAMGRIRRPFVVGRIAIPSQDIADDVNLLIDTGADGTLLSPSDATRLRINLAQLSPGPPSTGVGGRVPTVYADATLTLDNFIYQLAIRILAPRSPAQQQALARIPSLLGRDILAHFALFFEQRTGRVLLLTPEEADALALPR
jgi:predicted aspartyl protease